MSKDSISQDSISQDSISQDSTSVPISLEESRFFPACVVHVESLAKTGCCSRWQPFLVYCPHRWKGSALHHRGASKGNKFLMLISERRFLRPAIPEVGRSKAVLESRSSQYLFLVQMYYVIRVVLPCCFSGNAIENGETQESTDKTSASTVSCWWVVHCFIWWIVRFRILLCHLLFNMCRWRHDTFDSWLKHMRRWKFFLLSEVLFWS